MLNLILKDILIQKKILLFSILYACFFTFAFKSTISMASIAVPVVISYMLSLGACACDDKNKSEIMLNSLPINRTNLVISKYLSTFVFIFIGLFLVFTAGTILNIFGFIHFNRLINLEDIVGAIVACSLLNCLYFPFYFKFGYHKSRYVIYIIFFAIFLISTISSKNIFKNITNSNFLIYLNSQPDWLVISFIIVITAIIFLVSMLLSIKIYINKDF